MHRLPLEGPAPSDTALLDAQRHLDPEDHSLSALLPASSTAAFPSLFPTLRPLRQVACLNATLPAPSLPQPLRSQRPSQKCQGQSTSFAITPQHSVCIFSPGPVPLHLLLDFECHTLQIHSLPSLPPHSDSAFHIGILERPS